MKTMNVSVLFDRKKQADTKSKRGLVQVVVCYDRRRWYFSTGIKVLKHQWNANLAKCQNVDASGMLTQQYNKKIELYLQKCEEYEAERLDNGWEFDIDALKKRFEGGVSDNFIEWARARVKEKEELLRHETVRSHMNNLNIIEEFGIKKFSDLTLENIVRFNEWMIIAKHYLPQTVETKNKVLRLYCGEALLRNKIKVNPYATYKVSRGAAENKRIITESEMLLIASADIPDSYEKVRDFITLQWETGFAYCDLVDADFSAAKDVNGILLLRGRRQKSGAEYFVPLSDKVLEILAKYGGKVPEISNQQVNVRLKKVCELAGLEDYQHITSHAFRKGAGSKLLNHGVRMETVSKFLGHTNIKITEKIYAKLEEETIAKEIKSGYTTK